MLRNDTANQHFKIYCLINFRVLNIEKGGDFFTKKLYSYRQQHVQIMLLRRMLKRSLV